MIKSFINRFKSSRSFKDFYTDWLNTLKSTHLPLFNALFSFDHPNYSLLSTQVNLLTNHFNSYFAALDLAANDDVSQLLFPDWRNSLEKPFLWFGDFHPYIFTNLLRSFIQDDDSDDHSEDNVWKNAGVSLRHFVEQLECGLRLMVPVIVTRSRDSQAKLVLKLAVEWREKGENLEVGEVIEELIDEITCVFLDANRLRKSVLADIMATLSVHQSALFLQRLSQFYVGFSNST
ncbi:unnamed protein product [Amaranthus hypochondriacus]